MSPTVETPRPRLSVCIPTYNFGRFIRETLDSVLCQMCPGVEIIVLDSGSTDDTPSVVQQLQHAHECLRYVRAEERRGIDRDMAEVVRLARGDYCWLFSADDLMKPGALTAVLSEIGTGHDVYLCMHSNDSLTMQQVDASHPVLNLQEGRLFQLADADQQSKYFALALTTEAFFSFMGGLIVRKPAWDSVQLNEAFVGTCWAHVARLFELMTIGLTVKYLAKVLVRRRADNDSFASRGVVRRYALAIEGYQQLGAYFWGGKSDQALHIRRVLRREFRLGVFLNAKRICAIDPQVEDRQLLNQLFASVYSDPLVACWVSRVAFRVLPGALVVPARRAYQFLRACRRGSIAMASRR